MANQNKTVVPGKAHKNNSKSYKIKKDKDSEVDIDIDIEEDGDYDVEKLSTDGLPTHMSDGTSITWFNNFAIKKNNQYINQKYKVKINGISNMGSSKKLVIFDGNGDPYYYTGSITNDTFEMTDGDPAVGTSP